jgi:hypothetical protein
MDHPRPGLRYVDASDLESSTIAFDGMNVESTTGEKLGDVDGFIIDLPSSRPFYVVVDAGGWFTSKFFLLPVGHVGIDSENRKLIADVPRERIRNYPGFDRDEFAQLSDEELNQMDERMIAACCPDELTDRSKWGTRYEYSSHYRSPNWWDSNYYRPDRADTAARSMGSIGSTPASTSSTSFPSRNEVRAERDRELVTARESSSSAGDVSPHFGGRAQPGDVLGVETGGEQTHVGDTSDDENKRREDAEKAARKDRR